MWFANCPRFLLVPDAGCRVRSLSCMAKKMEFGFRRAIRSPWTAQLNEQRRSEAFALPARRDQFLEGGIIQWL